MPGRHIDRRALLQRARRSPIRPRSSSADENAKNVSAAKAERFVSAWFGREDMGG